MWRWRIMSSYSTQLRTLIEGYKQNEPSLSHAERIEKGRTRLFNFDYPIFQEEYRQTFETNFIRRFYMAEIGFETEGLFKFHLESWLQLHMPYFNKLFLSEMVKYDPLSNTNIVTGKERFIDKKHTDIKDIEQSAKSEGSSDSTSSETGSNTNKDFTRDLQSDTPDSRLAITTSDGKGVIEYASNIGEHSGNNEGTSNSSFEGSSNSENTTSANQKNKNEFDSSETDKTTEITTGKVGTVSFSKMIIEHRLTFLRIEADIYREMRQLFMLVY